MNEIATGSEFVSVINLQLLPNWYELSTGIQRDFVAQLNSIMERYQGVAFSWYDADAWTSEITDFVLCEFVDINEYNALWSELRRHPFLATPYARIEQVVMGMELEIDGLAKLADAQEHRGFSTPLSLTGMSLPPETPKPEKPVKSPLIKRPPRVQKPEKSRKRKQEQPEPELICHFCGHMLSKKAKYCGRCGTSLH